MERKGLLVNGLVKLTAGVVLVGLLLFLPAGSFGYSGAWLFLGLLFVPMLTVGIFLYVKAPDLMRKRLNSKETEKEQKGIILLSTLVFIAMFVLAGLSFRFGWLPLPIPVIIVAAVVQLVAYGLWAEVMRENAFLSRTVEIQENQTVVDTGLYGIVRHPMYFSAVLLYLSIPLVLGSLLSFAVSLLLIPVLVMRILNEEKVLENGLEGYREYKQKVKYRLIPFIW